MPTAANDPETPCLDVSSEDLHRYVAGGLSPSRRRAVEGLLACNPDLASQVMTQLHLGGAKRSRRRRPHRLAMAVLAMGMAACAASAVAGWTAAELSELDGWRELDGQTPPEYVQEAAESRQATLARAAMASQIETPRLDAGEIQRTLKVDLPRLPADWRVVDVQVYPTDEGPSVNVMIEGPNSRRLCLFVVRADTSATARPELAMRGREVVAFWERGNSAYVLSGEGPHHALLAEASALANGKNL